MTAGDDKLAGKRRALVLAGGGYVASSWEIGLVTGMADAGLDVRNADLFVGTSSGSRVALDLTSGEGFEEIYRRRAEPAGPSAAPPGDRAPVIDWERIRAGVDEAKRAGGNTAEILRRYGVLALGVAPAASAERRETVAAQLSVREWPRANVLIAVVNAETGERRVFDRASGLEPADAIIASTASFGAAPLWFEGQHYIDGGYHSSDNADLAIGCERVLILALRSPPNAMRLVPIEAGVEALRAAGAQVVVIHPDEETMAALDPTGGHMNPGSGRPAAIAGRLQGQRAVSEELAAFWGRG